MVANLYLLNCPLPAFRKMETTQKLFASRWTIIPNSSRPPKTAEPTNIRGKFWHLAQGNRGLIIVKGADQRKIFEKLGLFTIDLETLPHFQDLNDLTLLDHLHDEAQEDYDISESTMVKSYKFVR
ncbi:hypothetical protein TNCV_813251 [Trichonephila clavipes]|nr:hypothetical protein TNCV_813251 [Trichonephila clavipes]